MQCTTNCNIGDEDKEELKEKEDKVYQDSRIVA